MSDPEQGRHLGTDGVMVETATVSLKVVRVGKKQMTLSVFRQLPCVHLVEPGTPRGAPSLIGKPWGTVNYFWDSCGLLRWPHAHVVWSSQGRLFRACVGRIRRGQHVRGEWRRFWGDPHGLNSLPGKDGACEFRDSGFPCSPFVDARDSPEATSYVSAWNALCDDLEGVGQLFIAV